MPGKTKPHKARKAKKKYARIRKVGTLEDARKELWRAILCARDVLQAPGNEPKLTLRAVHAMVQATTAYAKLVEVGELEARLSELEKSRDAKNNGYASRAYA